MAGNGYLEKEVNKVRIKLDFSLSKNDNDVNLTPNQVCEMVESILLRGSNYTNAYIDNIYSIERSEEDD